MHSEPVNMWTSIFEPQNPIYEHYRQRGWATTAALVILARKLARVAFAMTRDAVPFDPACLKTT